MSGNNNDADGRSIDIVEDTTVKIKNIMGGVGGAVLFIAALATAFRDVQRDISNITDVLLVRIEERHEDLKGDVDDLDKNFDSFKSTTGQQLNTGKSDLDRVDSRLSASLRDASLRISDVEERVGRLKLELNKLNRTTVKHNDKYEDMVDGIVRDIEDIKRDLK